MRASRFFPTVAPGAFALLALAPAPSARAQSWRSFTEDFSTTAHRDAVGTTALWDTGAGELRAVPFSASTLSNLPLTSAVLRVRIINGLAYVCTNGSGLVIVNVDDLAAPAVLGSWSETTTVHDVVQFGGLSIATLGNGNFALLDTSNPASIGLLGYSPVGGTTYGIAREGNNVLVADGAPGVVVVNESAGVIGTVNTPGSARDLDVEGDVLYVADEGGGLRCVDYRDPAAPVEIGNLPLSGNAYALCVRGDRAYVAAGTAGLAVADVSDPTAPALVGSLPLSGTSVGIDVVGDRAFVASQTGGTRVVDIRNPAVPALLDTYAGTSSNAVLALSSEVLVGDGAALKIRRWASPIAPQGVSSRFLPQSGSRICVQGDLVYVAGELGGLQIVDVADIAAPAGAGSFSTGSFVRGLDVEGNVAYLADINNGFYAVDVSDPSVPSLLDQLVLSHSARKVAVDGDLAFAGGSLGSSAYLSVVDIADPANLSFVTQLPIPGLAGFIDDLDVETDRALVSAENLGLVVVDVSTPASPTILHTFASPGGALTSTAVAGRYAYSLYAGAGLAIYDLIDLSQVSFTWGVSGDAVDILGNELVIGDGTSLAVYDVSDPAAPAFVTAGYAGDNINDLVIDGDRAILGTSGGLGIAALASTLLDASALNGASLPIDGADLDIGAVRLNADADGSMFFNVVLGSSVNFAAQDGQFHVLYGSGSDLGWRSLFDPLSPTLPRIRSLQLEWILTAPEFVTLTDVPDDQGGWARVRFLRSAYDAVSTADHAPVLGYNLHRRVDDAATVAAVRSQGTPVDQQVHDGVAIPLQGYAQALQWAGRIFIEPRASTADVGLGKAAPPGLWEVVGFVFATTADEYLALVPTLSDSATATRPTVYYISAHTATPGVFYASAPDSVYSIDNIAPGVPAGFQVAYNSAGNVLSWDPAPEYDYQFHRVYRGTSPDFVPGPGNLVKSVAGTTWTDIVAQPWSWRYKITAVDHAGNESAPASPGQLTTAPPVANVDAVRSLALHEPTPNPFNPRVTLRFDLPAAGRAQLDIFDLTGRRVRTLVDATMPAGTHSVAWDGTDAVGRVVASGVFVGRLRTPQGERRQKLVLVR